MNIRLAQETDLASILKVVETAFSDEENQVIMNFVQELSSEKAMDPVDWTMIAKR